MPPIQTIFEQLSKELGQNSPVLGDLKAWIHSANHARDIVAKRSTNMMNDSDKTLQAKVRQLRKRIRKNRKTWDAQWSDLRSEIQTLEDELKSYNRSMLHAVIKADCFKLGCLDDLLRSQPIAEYVNNPGARLLIVRPLYDGALHPDPSVLCCFDGGCRFTACNSDDEFREFLAKEEDQSKLFIFGCGGGFVTVECLYVSAPVARAKMPATQAVVSQFKDDIERMSREKWIRETQGDGSVVWRPPVWI